LKKNDVLEGNYSLWLKAKSININENETVMAIFPKGNFFTKGPEIYFINIDKTEKKEGDVILTDNRLMIFTGTETFESELFRIDTCIVSDNGKKIGKKEGSEIFMEDLNKRYIYPKFGGKKEFHDAMLKNKKK